MAGGLLLQQKTPRPGIRAEGIRLGFEGSDLDDFVEIVAALEDIDWSETLRQQSAELASALKRKQT
ncbi:MAG: hypothetical protein U1E60_06265 [Reyranellaceae bacterium]